MIRLVLIGMKASGKTATGHALAARLNVPFLDLDTVLEESNLARTGESLSFRQIFHRHGRDYFRALELAALRCLAHDLAESEFVLATGGGTPLRPQNQKLLAKLGLVIFLDAAAGILLPRIIADGIPAFFPYPDDPARSLAELLAARRPIYSRLADISLVCRGESPEQLAERIIAEI